MSSEQGAEGTVIRSGPGFPVSNSGFTRIEILVAISILAISLVVILQLFSGGLKSNRLSDQYTRGIFHAKEKMEEILLSTDFAEEEAEGEFGDSFRWKSVIVRIEQAENEEAKLPFNTFNIKVDVMWHEGDKEKHFEISTMKVVEKKKE
ncbi:MAG: type II secretion system GspH family protein [Candidatus Aminicenantes bacterium]|nr:type II secretion system GspH family protein [Candidatus Aminicenantes bacterium]